MQYGLGLEPISTALAAKAVVTQAVKADVVRRFTEGIAGVFGDTAKDKERKASAARALAEALNGNLSGLSWLLARANIRPNPAIVAPAPSSARYIFRKALREYYTTMNILPDPDIRDVIWGKISDIPAALRAQMPGQPGIVTTPAPVSPVSGGGLTPRPVVPVTADGTPVTMAGFGGSSPLVWLAVGGIALAVLSQRGRR